MQRPITLAFIAAVLALAAGCTEESIQARGFAMPPGDPAAGQATFIALQCQQCHTVAGVELPADRTMRDGPTVPNNNRASNRAGMASRLSKKRITPSSNRPPR